jgi:hypothetical protein
MHERVTRLPLFAEQMVAVYCRTAGACRRRLLAFGTLGSMCLCPMAWAALSDVAKVNKRAAAKVLSMASSSLVMPKSFAVGT